MTRWDRLLLTPGMFFLFAVAVAPALAQDTPLPAAPPRDISSEPLFETAFPATAVPAENPRIYFVRLRYTPGATFDRPAVPSVEYVVAGELVVRSAARITVHRGADRPAAATEAIAPGEETVVAAGDAVVHLSNDAAQTIHNPHATPASTLKVVIVAANEASRALPRGFSTVMLGHLSTFDWKRSALPVGPLRVRAERITAAPGAVMPPQATQLPVLRYVDGGELEWAVESLATLLSPRPTAIRFLPGQSVPYQRQPEGHRLYLRSSGREPLVLLVLTVTPEAGGGRREAGVG